MEQRRTVYLDENSRRQAPRSSLLGEWRWMASAEGESSHALISTALEISGVARSADKRHVCIQDRPSQ